MIDWLNTAYHNELLSGISDVTDKLGVNLICIVTGRLDSPLEWEKNRNILFDMISHRRIDGMIVVAPSLANFSGRDRLESFLKRYTDFPMVCIGEKMLEKPSILTDNDKGIRDIMNHLIGHHGYKKIAYVSGPLGSTDSEKRFTAYKDMILKHGFDLDENLIVSGNFGFSSGKEAVRILLDERKAQFDAIVSSNDYMALGIIDEMQVRGRFAADVVPVTGFDDIQESRKTKLTTVRQPVYDLGRHAAEVIIRNLNGENIKDDTIFPTELIIRESCGCFSGSVSASDYGSKDILGNIFSQDYIEIREGLISKITGKDLGIGDQNEAWVCESLRTLFDSIVRVIRGEKPADFLLTWSRIIREASAKDLGFSFLHILLSLFRQHMISYIPERRTLIETEDLFQEARIMIGDIIQRGDLIEKIMVDTKMENLSDLGAKLANTYTLEDQFRVLSSNLPALGIRSCFISLYEDPENPMNSSKLIFAFNREGMIKLPEEGRAYPTQDIIPDDILPNEKHFTMITENLFQGQAQLGFVIFEYGPRNAQLYEILRAKINDSLIGTLMFQKIQNQAKDLEKQVIERTSELYRTNAQLHLEMQEKLKAEEKLKKSEERFREMALLLPTVIVETDMNLNLVFLNRAGMEILEMNDESLKQRQSFLNFIMDDDRPKVEEYASQVITGQSMNFIALRLVKKDKSKITFLSKADPVYINNVIEGIRWNAIDIKLMISSAFKLEESFYRDYHFTNREREVLDLVIQGYKNREIADRLFIQTGSVKDHITSIYSKIGVTSREEFFDKMKDYQVNRFGYQSFVFTLLSKMMKE